MHAPQIIMLALYAMSLGTYLANHGKPMDRKYNFWSALLSSGIQVALMWWGGFFG